MKGVRQRAETEKESERDITDTKKKIQMTNSQGRRLMTFMKVNPNPKSSGEKNRQAI